MKKDDQEKREKETDQYTENVLKNGISRRSFLSRTAVGAAGVGVLGLAGFAPKSAAAAEAATLGKSSDGAATLSFLPKPKPIADKDIKATKTFDVIVIGAGAAGVPAALSAAENGAKVAVLQKQAIAVSQGNSGTGIDLANSDPAGVEGLIAMLMKDNAHRSNPKLVRLYAYNSGEAVRWVIDRSKQGGFDTIDQGSAPQRGIRNINGYTVNYNTSFMGPKPLNTGDGMRALAKTAEKAGVEFFYSTPAVQLIQTKSGEVTGVIGKGKDGKYTKFVAKKAVILATGDYQNNKAMSDYFVPDVKYFGRKQLDKTGDGIVMGYWAGGVIEPIGHTKMLHDFDAGPAPMCDLPFLAVNMKGKRFVNETVEMSLLNNYLRQPEKAGEYCKIFDSNYTTQAVGWPGRVFSPEELKNWMPEDPSPKKSVFVDQINTFKADTLEELAKKLKVDPAAFVATVKRYNEVVASGKDNDFGKPAKFLAPIEKGPFYGIHHRLRISALLSGLLVDENHQILNADGKPIKGLYAIGNVAAGFYGGVDYALTIFGMSLGHCYTDGYLTGKHVAKL